MKAFKSLIFSLIVLAGLGFFGSTTTTVLAQQPFKQDFSKVEHIDNYQVVIDVQANGQIYIKEHIEYDFADRDHHGIFRDIPYQYDNSYGKFNLRISDISVTASSGTPAGFTKTRNDGKFSIKIGDPNQTIIGKHTYDINYSVSRAINFFPDHDELYWNAIGTDWTVPILKSSVLVNLPAAAIQVECYVGSKGSNSTNCLKTASIAAQPQFNYDNVLKQNEGFTIVIGMPAGTITKPTTQQKVLDFIKDNGIVALPVVVFIIMFFVWRKFGKDGKGRGTIVAQFEPPTGLTPLYIGTLVDGKLDNRDFSAELIYLAVQGYIKIEKIETKKLLFFKGSDYKLIKLKEPDDKLPVQTKQLLTGLFVFEELSDLLTKNIFAPSKSELKFDSTGKNLIEVNLSHLKTNLGFGDILREMPNDVFKALKREGYYKYNPFTIRNLNAAAAMLVGFGLSVFLYQWFDVLGVVSAIASGVIIAIFGLIMPARTQKGAEMREYILGLKLYLGVAEKDRLAFANAPDKKPEQFEALLPYAVALGVEKEWAKQFEGIYNQQPTWYNDSTGAAFNVALLSSSIGDFSSSMQSAVTSMNTAASGGSGFGGGGVGGGGGGGGGGSW